MKTHAVAAKNATPARSGGAFFQQHATVRPTFFATATGTVQTALTVSQPGDAHEVEAEKMADQVVAGREAAFFQPAAGVQRQAAEPVPESLELDRAVEEKKEDVPETEEKAPAIQRSAETQAAPRMRISSGLPRAGISRRARRVSISRNISRLAGPTRSGERAARIDPSRARGPPQVTNDFENQLRGSKGGGRPLPGRTRVEMESAFGADFGGVRVHDGAGADKLSRGIEARAFTHGQDIYFSRNRYQPENREGQHLLAHELTHVIQQSGGIREGVRRMPELARVPPELQRVPTSMEEVRQDINGLAEAIPGYSLATIVIGYNPILGQSVAWSAANFFRGAAGLIPGGTAVYDKLNEGGAIDAAFAWIEGQIAARNLTWGRVSSLWDMAWERMGITEGISGNIEIFRGVFSGFFADVMGFLGAVADRLTAILRDLAVAAVRALFGNDGPAYDMISMVIGHDPLNGEARPWETVVFLRAALNFFGFGSHIAKMDETGQLQNAADWLDQQFGILSNAMSGLIGGIGEIWDSLGLATLANPLDVLTRTVGVVTEFVGRLLEFVGNLAAKILELIKAVIISLAREYARRIPGYRLFTVIIGLDPISGEGVPRTAMNFVRGFLEFVPNGEEIYRNLEAGNAIGRAMDWLGEQAAQLGLTPGAIVARFTALWTSFSINDLMNPIGAFERVAGVFLGFIGDVLTLAGRIALKLLEILFEVVMGGGGAQVLAILQEARGTFDTIVQDPVAFVGNLVSAAKLGFTQFAGHILEHLRTGLMGWLFGALEGAGIQMPATFDLRGILSLTLQILGLTYAQIRPQLVEQLGEPLVAHLETALEIVRILLTEGIAGIWSRITEFLTVSLPEMVIGAIKNFVMERIVMAAVTRIASMLNPAGAVIQAIMAIYNTVMFFIERMNQIMATVGAFVHSVSKIAAGNIGDAANAVEETMARTLPVIISFLARLLGLGGISEKIREIVERIRAPIRAALGRVIGWIVTQARRLGRGALQAGTGNMTKEEKFDQGMQLAVSAVNRFAGTVVGEGVLNPLLAVIRERYGFTTLQVVADGELWAVYGAMSPGKTSGTKAKVRPSREQLVLKAKKSIDSKAGGGIPESNVSKVATAAKSAVMEIGAKDLRIRQQLEGFVAEVSDPEGWALIGMLEPIRRELREAGREKAINKRQRPPASGTFSLILAIGSSGDVAEKIRDAKTEQIRTKQKSVENEGVEHPTRTVAGVRKGPAILTWNVGEGGKETANVPHHAEPHGVGYALSEDFHSELVGANTLIVSNAPWSPCSGCISQLTDLRTQTLAIQQLAGNVVLKRSILHWTQLWLCSGPTNMDGIKRLRDHGWDVIAPRSAFPGMVESDDSRLLSIPATPPQRKAISGDQKDRFEREADEAADAVLAGRAVAQPARRAGSASGGRAISSGSPLPDRQRAEMEDRFGHDFDAVRIHAGAADALASESIRARAFTRRAAIHFNSGEYRPDSASGRLLLAHELTHVIQQGAAPPFSEPSEPNTDMKIRPTFRRSARRVSRRAPDAPFFQTEAPESPFFTPAADVQKKPAEPKVRKIEKKPADEPPKKEEIQAKSYEDESVMAKCQCDSGGAEAKRKDDAPA